MFSSGENISHPWKISRYTSLVGWVYPGKIFMLEKGSQNTVRRRDDMKQRRFQDFFQGVAEISQWVAKISQGVAKKIQWHLLSLSGFCFPTHYITNLRPLFYILDSCYKEIHTIYIFILFLVRLLYFIRKFGSLQRSRFRGVETPLNGQGVASPPPETLRGWRDGPRHHSETATDRQNTEFRFILSSDHSVDREITYFTKFRIPWISPEFLSTEFNWTLQTTCSSLSKKQQQMFSKFLCRLR